MLVMREAHTVRMLEFAQLASECCFAFSLGAFCWGEVCGNSLRFGGDGASFCCNWVIAGDLQRVGRCPGKELNGKDEGYVQ